MPKLALAEPTRPALRYAHGGRGHGRLPGDVGSRASAAGTVGEGASRGAGFGWFGRGIVAGESNPRGEKGKKSGLTKDRPPPTKRENRASLLLRRKKPRHKE